MACVTPAFLILLAVTLPAAAQPTNTQPTTTQSTASQPTTPRPAALQTAAAEVYYAATSTQVRLYYETASQEPCHVEASASPQFAPLLVSVDPVLLPGSSSDERFRSLRQGARRTFVLGSMFKALIAGREIPLWLQPNHIYHVRIHCEDLRWEGAVRTEPGTASAAELDTATSCARFLSSGSWFPATSQSYLADVDAPPGCSWQVATGAPWILVAANSGTGPGRVAFTLEANTGPLRIGSITMAGQAYVVQQLGSSSACTYQISTLGTLAPPGGGAYLVTVTAPPGCAWTATSAVEWIRIVDAERGSGPAMISILVEENSGNLRSAEINIAGQVLRIDQAAGGCTVSIAPAAGAPASVSAAGGTFGLNVSANSGCGWAASTNANWIRIVEGSTGAGAGVIRYAVEANGPVARSAQITVGNATHTIRQEASTCVFRLGTAASWFPASGGAFKIDLLGPPACPWSATSPVSWVRLTGVTPKSDGFTIGYQLDENWYASRTASLSIAGLTLQIQQTGYGWPPGCSVRLGESGSTWFPATAGQVTNTLTVAAPAGCAWIATSNAPWLILTGNPAGVGSGSLSYVVQNNPGPTRSAAITAGLQRFVVNQAGLACDYSLSYSESWFPATGGAYQVTANGPPECSFTTTTTTAWITAVTPATGAGPAVVSFTLEPNASGAARTGQILIAGKPLTVRQSP